MPWERLDQLVPDDLDRYWQLTLEFLKIAARSLAEHSRGARHDRTGGAARPLIEAEAARLASRPERPVIAAGSTGSMPATAELIATIAKLPHGAVVLPGLDTDLDDAIVGADRRARRTDAPPVGHPQFAMQALLQRIGIARDEVKTLGARRRAMAREALRLARRCGRPPPPTAGKRSARSMSGARSTARSRDMSVIEAANAEEEALAIAVALREAVETRGKTAALVTPDRALARRVGAALARWNMWRSTIPAATRCPTPEPACSRGWRRKPRSAGSRR